MATDILDIPPEAYDAGEAALADFPLVASGCLDAASEVLHAAVPLDRIAELQRIIEKLEALRRNMLTNPRIDPVEVYGIGPSIDLIKARIAELRGGAQ